MQQNSNKVEQIKTRNKNKVLYIIQYPFNIFEYRFKQQPDTFRLLVQFIIGS